MGDELYRLALVCLLGGVVFASAIFLASTVVGSMADKRREALHMNVSVKFDSVYVQTGGQTSIYSQQVLEARIRQFPRVDYWKHYLNLLLESRAPQPVAQPQAKEAAE